MKKTRSIGFVYLSISEHENRMNIQQANTSLGAPVLRVLLSTTLHVPMHAHTKAPVLDAHFVLELLAQAFRRVWVLTTQQLGPHFQNGDVTPKPRRGLR